MAGTDPNYIAPNASPKVQQFILAARTLMYKMTDDLHHAMTGANTLTDGVAVLLVQLVTQLEQKMGELEPPEVEQVLIHLAGPVVDMAKQQGDPDAKDTKQATTDIVGRAMELMMGEEDQESPGQQQSEMRPDPSQAPLMGGPGGP